MTLEQLVQLICFNPRGATLTPEEEDFITRYRVSSFVLFARNLPNYAAARHMIARLHELAERPLIAVDQEGGRVIRLPPPATHFPSPIAVGATYSPDLAFRAGQATARELRAMNLNVVLAPVLDVNCEPLNPVIGTRAFGETPEHVSEMGVAWLRGAQGEGIAACAKHFPGHGDTKIDSHAAMPVITKSRAELERVELAPFRAAIAAGVELVMPGHLLVTALDDERPSSLSRAIITDLLRNDMGFDGVVISDALEMNAITWEYGIPTGAVAAVIAGCDLVCPIVLHDKVLRALQRAVEDGRLALRQVETSIQRIQRLRDKVTTMPAANPAWLGAPTHQALAQEIATRAIRVNGQRLDRSSQLPLPPLPEVAVIEFALGQITLAEGPAYNTSRLLKQLRARQPALMGIALPFNPDEHAMSQALTIAQRARGLIIAIRQALHCPAQPALVRQLLAFDKPTVLVALRDPYDLSLFPQASCAITLYDDSPATIETLVSFITN
jgi:beta-N-acetylhexosaminidase